MRFGMGIKYSIQKKRKPLTEFDRTHFFLGLTCDESHWRLSSMTSETAKYIETQQQTVTS